MRREKKRNSEKMTVRHIKTSTASKVFDTANALLMILFCITIIFPIWDVVVRSLSSPADISLSSFNLFPKHINFDAYKYCLEDNSIFAALRTSIARTIVGTVIHLSVVSLAAYALTKTQLPCIKVIQAYFIIPMFVGAGTIPAYLNMQSLGLINSFWVYVLPTAFSMYNCIVVRNYFYSIDKSLEESASIDGASMLRIFMSIILPLSKPVLATVALWQMVGQWNAWFDNMMYNLQSDELLTLQYKLRLMLNKIINQYATTSAMDMENAMNITAENVKAAITLLVVVPVVCVYPFIQKYFVKGIMVGAVKG